MNWAGFFSLSSNNSNILKSKKETSSTLISTVKKQTNKLRTQSHTASSCPAVSSTKQFDEAGMAVGLVLLLLEAAFAQGLEAEVAHEVVGVEFGSHGSDAAAQDRLLAGLAHATTGLVVVGLTQRLTLVFEEAAIDEGAVALLKKRGSEIQTQHRALTHGAVIRKLSCEMTTFS